MTNDRISLILDHSRFTAALAQINAREAARIYCRHDLEHLLAVARIAYITALEEHLPYEREIIYAAALLHDLGRSVDGADHAAASALLAEEILPDCGFTAEECAQVIHAIAAHRQKSANNDLAALLYAADKLSRPCFACRAADSCYWPGEKRNHTIRR